MSKAEELFKAVEMITGLTIDDFMKGLDGTPEEQQQAHINNLTKMFDFQANWKHEYEELRELPGVGTVGLQRFMFTYGLMVGLNDVGYNGRYCYEKREDACAALKQWDGTGDPPGLWIKYKGRGGERLGPGAVEEDFKEEDS